MEMPKLEPPSVRLATRMLADDTIQPPFHTARQRKVSAVNRQHECIVEDSPVEPVRYDQIDSVGVPVCIGTLRPFIDPGEPMHPPFAQLTQRCGDRRRLQAIE